MNIESNETKINKKEEKSNEITNFQCETCDKLFAKNVNLKIHIRIVHLEEKKFHCEICNGKSFKQSQELKSHVKKIHPKEYGEFQKPREKAECPICKEKIDKTYLKKHVRTIHEGKRDHIYKCEHCGKEYVEKKCLRAHIKRHENVRDEKCNQCGKLFLSTETLRRHIGNVHNKGNQKIKCDM